MNCETCKETERLYNTAVANGLMLRARSYLRILRAHEQRHEAKSLHYSKHHSFAAGRAE